MDIAQNNQFLSDVIGDVFGHDQICENIQDMITEINRLNDESEQYFSRTNHLILSNDDFSFDMDIGNDDVFFSDGELDAILAFDNHEQNDGQHEEHYEVHDMFHYREVNNDGEEVNHNNLIPLDDSFMVIDVSKVEVPVQSNSENEQNRTRITVVNERYSFMGVIKDSVVYIGNSIMSIFGK